MLPRLRSLLWSLLRRSEFERELEDEIRLHQEDRAEDLARRGLSGTEAAREARIEFGSVEKYKEEVREAHGLALFDGLRGDIRYALRSFRHSPGFAAVAVVTLALAIGVNTAMFTFLNAYLFRPFPVAEPSRNVRVMGTEANAVPHETWSYPEFSDIRARNTVFHGVYAASYGFIVTLRDPAARTARVSLVSGNFFRLLNGRVVLGRPIGPEDDTVPGRDAVLVAAHHAWVRFFGADPAIIGRKVRIEQATFTIVGVSEPGFAGTELIAPDFWAPTMMAGQIGPEQISLTGREQEWLSVAGLLKPGVTVQQASDSISAMLPELNAARRPDNAIVQAGAVRWSTVFLIDAHTVQGIVLCFAGFGLVLLIACANLASLLMSRATARHREIAIRASLGASRGRLVRQLLTESVMLASAGAALGLLLTSASTAAIQRYLFGFIVKLGIWFEPVSPDWHVFAFGAMLALLAGILFGLAPALSATAPSSLAANVCQEAPASSGRSRPRRVRDALIVGEVTASLVLLVSAGLFFRMAQRVAGIDHGYAVGQIVDVRLKGSRAELVRRLAADERVVSVAETYRTPLSGSLPQLSAVVDGRSGSLGYNFVDHQYFSTLGITIRRGRGFTLADTRESAPIAIVSEATARRLWTNADPIGKTFRVAEPKQPQRYTPGTYQVVGVAADVVNGRLDEGPDWTSVYFPAAPDDARDRGLLVRVKGAPATFVPDLRNACFELGQRTSCDPIPLVDRAWLQRFPYTIVRDISAGVGCLALGLTSVGLYGVVAFAAVRRRREVGIRMALGARAGRVRWMLVGECARRVGAGIAIGLPLCLGLSWAAMTLLRHAADLPLLDPAAYIATPLFLAAVATLATWLPARRATLDDPAIVLRQE